MTKREIQEKIKKTIKNYEKSKTEIDNLEILNNKQKGYIVLENNEKHEIIDQEIIKNHVNIETLEKAYEIDLEYGRYNIKYDSTGRYSLLYEENGSLGMFDTKTKHIFFDEKIEEKIKDAIFLHNELFIAVAQNKNLYIYDSSGKEIHCVRKIKNSFKLDFLKYHFLLTSISSDSMLRYLDTSIGKLVCEINTKERNTCMTKNPSTGVIYLGNENGTVTLWTPNDKEYAMKILCHTSNIKNIEVERFGSYMITNGNDNQIKIWDIRNNYSPLNIINTDVNFSNMILSQNNKLALGFKNKIKILTDITVKKNLDADYLYLQEKFSGKLINNMQFCPFEDILSVGHTRGLTNLIIPGSGDPTFDSYEDSPFRTKQQRRELEVRNLLDKIPYEMIRLNGSLEVFKY